MGQGAPDRSWRLPSKRYHASYYCRDLGDLFRAAGDERANRAQCGDIKPVVHPPPALLPLQQAGLNQLLEMVGQRRLRDAQSSRKVTRAGGRVRGIRHQAKQTKPDRVCKRLQHGSESFGLSCRHKRLVAGRRTFQDGQDSGHA